MTQPIDEVWDDDMQAAALGMMTEARSAKAEALPSLDAARRHPQGSIILRSSMSDHPYLVCDGAMVRCAEDRLWQLLSDLDHVIWSDGGEELPILAPGERLRDGGPSGGARITFAALNFDANDEAGEGGIATGGMWVHPDFHARGLAEAIAAVIEGKQPRLGLTEVPPSPEDAELTW